jgi:hypothetical protein
MNKEWRPLAATACGVVGAIVMVVGWVGVSQNTETYEQVSYLLSGGIGGLVLVLVGLGLFNAHQHAQDQARIEELGERLRALELGLGGEFDEVLQRLDNLAADRHSQAAVGG